MKLNISIVAGFFIFESYANIAASLLRPTQWASKSDEDVPRMEPK